MDFKHTSGVLMHISSLPGPYGIGDLGPQAHAFVDFLQAAGIRWWQTLPLGPTGYGDSPYQSYSSFAANPNLISPDLMAADGLIDDEHLTGAPKFPVEKVDFNSVIEWKRGLFQVAFMRLKSLPELGREFEAFRAANASWLDDFSLFMTLKAQHEQQAWRHWPAPYRDREPAAIAKAKHDFASTQVYYAFQQFLFFRQWAQLRAHMAERGVAVIGDLTIYVAHDSADVWTRRELFELDEQGEPIRVAGVPPDMFTATGQLWGNPLYRWDLHKQQGFSWWLSRLRGVLGLVDALRLDHFRGFADYYTVPAGETTAINGAWELGPGAAFFEAVQRELGDLPLIAEDLGGDNAPQVIALRDQFHLPGMKVFQFGFDSGLDHAFLPHNYPVNCVGYPGTHDNETFMGWFTTAKEAEQKFCLEYIKSDGSDVAWRMLRSLWDSKATLVVAPLQDFLGLGAEARMNYPGTALGNWGWRVRGELLTPELAQRIAALNREHDRRG
jgi:4-alpha-glucanotransferase